MDHKGPQEIGIHSPFTSDHALQAVICITIACTAGPGGVHSHETRIVTNITARRAAHGDTGSC